MSALAMIDSLNHVAISDDGIVCPVRRAPGTE